MGARLLAIDPGTTESGWVQMDTVTYRPIAFGKDDNDYILRHILPSRVYDHAVIEMIASYGMPVGQEVFDTCVWIGRFHHEMEGRLQSGPDLVKRQPVRQHHCHSTKATDATVSQALQDRFAYGVRNHGKGTKDEPGFFYGFKKDIWQSYALGVYYIDHMNGETDGHI